MRYSGTDSPILSFQILIQKLQHFLLRLQTAGMRYVPKFRIQQIISSLTLPNLAHFCESILYARYRKELVFCTIDEEHRFRTGEGGDVRFVDKKSIFLFIRLVIVCKIKKLSAKRAQ